MAGDRTCRASIRGPNAHLKTEHSVVGFFRRLDGGGNPSHRGNLSALGFGLAVLVLSNGLRSVPATQPEGERAALAALYEALAGKTGRLAPAG